MRLLYLPLTFDTSRWNYAQLFVSKYIGLYCSRYEQSGYSFGLVRLHADPVMDGLMIVDAAS